MAVTSRRVLAADDVEPAFDDWIFTIVIGGAASLSFVVHIAATTVGLSLVSGCVLLALWHLACWLAANRIVVHNRGPQGLPGLFEIVAVSVFLGTLITWVPLSAASLDISGPDAAHYHVPNAINLAKGVSPFDLPATPHLYPMAGSAVAAWFILPAEDLHFVDLAMALPFLMIAASVNVIFRAATGLSGLAWGSWLTLLLFSTPMFRASTDGSADLWFAAGSAAVVAVMVRAWWAGTWRKVDVMLLGGAIGLLIGSKTTGVPAAGLFLATGALVAGARRVFGGPRPPGVRLGLAPFAIAAVVAIGAGGIWLIRNWIQFGSPLAPAGLSVLGVTIFEGETHQQTTYFSVLGEMQSEHFRLWPRASHYIDQWFGAAFLPALAIVSLLVLDLVLTAGRRHVDGRWWARAGGLFVTIAAGGILVWMLIGAPWTALERSNGLTLRYALPVFALLAMWAFAGAFPLKWPWFERWPATLVIQAILCGGSVVRFAESASKAGPPAPPFSVVWTGAALALVAVVFFLSWKVGRRMLVASALALVVGLTLVGQAKALGASARRSEAFFRERSESGGGGITPNLWRGALFAVLADETSRRQVCTARRFFSLTRNDLPLALQPPGVTSRIFYAGRDVASARKAGPIGRCDYVVTTPALAGTEKGRQLVEALSAGAALEALTPDPALIVLRLR